MSTEWIAGTFTSPQDLTREEDAAYRREALLWLDADGSVLGTATFEAAERDAAIEASFRAATRATQNGERRVPTRVRVASPELAESMRAAVGSATEVVCAATPEIDERRESFVEYLKETDFGRPTYLTPGHTEEAVAGMFRAAARLHRAQPWRVIPAEDAVLAVTIPELGVEDGRILVIGHDTRSHGVILFRDEATLERYLDVCAQMASGAGDRPVFPPQLVLSFEARAEADPALVRQVEERRWELAGPSAFPALDAVDDDGVARAPTAEETVKLEAVALAIAELIESTPDLGMILERQDGLARAIEVETSRGRTTVAIATEARENPYTDRPFDIHEDLGSDGDIDEERALAFEEELVRQFVESDEGVPLGLDAHWARGLLEHARKYHGVTVTELTPDVVEDVVFVDFPRQVSCEGNEAPAIVASVRAFLAFLERAFGLGGMAQCAAVLGKSAEAKLRQRLSDPRYFGMAKRFVMAGMKAGYDIRTREGAAAWMRVANSRLSNGSAPRPASKPDPAKKDKRKAQRASRRKNRR